MDKTTADWLIDISNEVDTQEDIIDQIALTLSEKASATSGWELLATYNIEEEVGSFSQTLSNDIIDALRDARRIKINCLFTPPVVTQASSGSLTMNIYKGWVRNQFANNIGAVLPQNTEATSLYNSYTYFTVDAMMDCKEESTVSNLNYPIYLRHAVSVRDGAAIGKFTTATNTSWASYHSKEDNFPYDSELRLTTSTVIGAGSYIKIYMLR